MKLEKLDDLQSIHKIVSEQVNDYPDANSSWIAHRILDSLTEAELATAAYAHVMKEIAQVKRTIARSLERRNTRSQSPPNNGRQAQTKSDDERLDRYRKWKKSPAQLGFLNTRERDRFKTWLGDDFDDWLTRAQEVITSGGEVGYAIDNDTLWADWVGSHSELRVKRITNNVLEMVIKEAEQITLELTEDLLNSEFALGDGTKTTWGQAGVQHHEQRVEMLTKHSAGTLETAARHMAAIQVLKNTNCKRLNDVDALEKDVA